MELSFYLGCDVKDKDSMYWSLYINKIVEVK
jgi:hypothetical protein